MLGKTNITTLSEGAIVTEVEDFNWIQMQSGVYGNFVKAIYKNDYLVAITADGTIAYTTDGEVWQTSVLEYEDCKLNDIEWDGRRFILVGRRTDTFNEITGTFGLILVTNDFETFAAVNIENTEDMYSESNGNYDIEYYAVYIENGQYILLVNRRLGVKSKLYLYKGDLINTWSTRTVVYSSEYHAESLVVAKNSSEMLVCFNGYKISNGAGYYNHVYKINNAEVVLVKLLSLYETCIPMVYAIEGKDILYYMSKLSADNYAFAKVSEANEVFSISTGQNYSFKSGAYFNGCQLFINSHEMLIVKKGESIADKTLDDLIEIAPELTMNYITKAFGQLYIFGNQGVILKSSVETNNENAITVQTLSAKKALSDAKQYTDEQYAILEARIAALEGETIE